MCTDYKYSTLLWTLNKTYFNYDLQFHQLHHHCTTNNQLEDPTCDITMRGGVLKIRRKVIIIMFHRFTNNAPELIFMNLRIFKLLFYLASVVLSSLDKMPGI